MGTPRPWALNADAFALLLAALGENRETAAVRYEELRERLIRVFRWEQGLDPAGLADEALSRLARRLQEGERVENVIAYLHGIARNLLREDAQRRQRETALSDLQAVPAPSSPDVEWHHQALEACLAELEPDKRRLLLEYYRGDQGQRIVNRQRLAKELGLEMNALRNRALRLREKLEECVRARLERDISMRRPTGTRTAR